MFKSFIFDLSYRLSLSYDKIFYTTEKINLTVKCNDQRLFQKNTLSVITRHDQAFKYFTSYINRLLSHNNTLRISYKFIAKNGTILFL